MKKQGIRSPKKALKREIRVLGIDDSPFDKFGGRGKKCLVVGALYRGGNYPDGVLSTKVRVDGSDSTDRVAAMVNSSKFKPQLNTILIDGIAFAGFNVVDIHMLNKKTGIPVIAVVRRKPDIKKIKQTLEKLGMEGKIALIDRAGAPVRAGKVWIQFSGADIESAREVIRITSTHSHIPEPIRLAHMIASGIATGESRGDA